MYDLNNRTLAYFKDSLLYKNINFSQNITVQDYIDKNNSLSTTLACPIQEVAAFYLIDQCFFILHKKYGLHESLSEEDYVLAKSMHNEINKISNRMFCFILSCCLKELQRFPIQNQHPSFSEYIATGYDPVLAESVQQGKIAGLSFKHMSLEKFVAANVAIFSSGKWWFGAGGSGWANIARAPLAFLRSSSNLHEMTDLSFSLCHDRGSFFDRVGWGNNGQLKEVMRSIIPVQHLYELLDIQASGQIPQYLKKNQNYLSKTHAKFLNVFSLLEPKLFNAPIDMSTVKKNEKIRCEKLEKQWKQSQMQHNNIAQHYAGGTAQALPKVEKIDKILIEDYRRKGLIPNV